MKTIRAIFFPREPVPLAVHPQHGDGLEGAASNADLWRESDRFMRTPEFTEPITRRRKWTHREKTWEWGEVDDDG